MNSQKHQIQTLIVEIDALLQSLGSRFSWFTAKSLTQPRQTLERLREYLVQHQQELASVPAPTPATEAQQMLQVLTQEVRGLRASVLQPLRAEVVTLMHQRDALQQEVQQLQAQKPSQALETIANSQVNQQVMNEFLQVLMARLQENLTQQVVEMLAHHVIPAPLAAAPPGIAGPETWDAPLQHSTQQLEQIQQLHDRTDQVLGNLDHTLSVVFESLHHSIQTYQDSLAQGVDKMHTLGKQGEALLAALVEQLTLQLQQPAPAPLPITPTPEADWLGAVSPLSPVAPGPPWGDRLEPKYLKPKVNAPQEAIILAETAQLIDLEMPSQQSAISLPYPGTELRSPASPSSEAGAAPIIASAWLESPAAPPAPAAQPVLSLEPDSRVALDEIHSLTELFQKLTNPAETTPIVMPIGPPDIIPAALPPLETAVAVAAPGLATPDRATPLIATSVPAPEPVASYTIFSLEGMDDLFLDPPPHQTRSIPAAKRMRQLPDPDQP